MRSQERTIYSSSILSASLTQPTSPPSSVSSHPPSFQLYQRLNYMALATSHLPCCGPLYTGYNMELPATTFLRVTASRQGVSETGEGGLSSNRSDRDFSFALKRKWRNSVLLEWGSSTSLGGVIEGLLTKLVSYRMRQT